MRLLASLFIAMGVYAQSGTALKESAQADYMAAKYTEAASKFSTYAASGDKEQKIDGLYWEAMSRFQAVEQGDELLSRADSTCQALLSVAAPGDSLYFAGQLLSSYMALKKDPKLALKRFEASSKNVPKSQKARYLWVGYLVNVKNRNLDRAQLLKSQLLKEYPDSPEASNVRMNDPEAQVAEVKVKSKQAPKRGETVELNLGKSPTVNQQIPASEVAVAPQSVQSKIVPPDLNDSSESQQAQSGTPNASVQSSETPSTPVLSAREQRAQAKAEKARLAAEKRAAAAQAKAEKAKAKAEALAQAKLEAQAKAEELRAAKEKAKAEKLAQAEEPKAKSLKTTTKAEKSTSAQTSDKLSAQEKAKAEKLAKAKAAKAEKAKLAAEKKAAEKIAQAKAAKEKAKAEKLAKAEEAKTAKELKKAAASGSKGDFYLQFGSFKSKESAQTYAKSIQSKTGAAGLKVVDHEGVYKVRLFGFSSKDAAQGYAQKKIKAKGFDALVVQSQNP